MSGAEDLALPRIAYVLLWFPRASETFIFREVAGLRQLGLPIHIYTLYGRSLRGCSAEMRAWDGPLTRFGAVAVLRILAAFFAEFVRRPGRTARLMRRCLFRRMRDIEALAENIWSFFAGFALAELCRRDKIEFLHAPWANGPCTAAWVASLLTGIPFAFTARAGDIYPPDGLLAEKLADCRFARVNTAANVRYLAAHAAQGDGHKIVLVYNVLTLPKKLRRIPSGSICELLAVGRFAKTKGFQHLLGAMARLKREAFPCRLTLVGDGWLRPALRSLCRRLRLEDTVTMPGFVPHDRMREFLETRHMLIAPCVVAESGDRDGIPNVILEALSQGMPVIATDAGGIDEVVRHEETGLMTMQRDIAGLARAIKRLASDAELAARMAAQGERLVREIFDPEKNIRTLFSLYVEQTRRTGAS